MENLNITLVQTPLHWENAEKNLAMFDNILSAITRQTNLILLPEMFATGFSMNTSLAETMDGRALAWMKAKAKEKNCVIAGSLMIKEAGKNFNRFLWVSPLGDTLHYDKRHLFRMANEHLYFSAGETNITPELNGWKIRPQVCYDLRFPVWSRNRKNEQGLEYDVLIYVANWPARRSLAWNTLLPARAVENQCYIVAVNRTGTDGNGVEYSGGSAVFNPLGEKLSAIQLNENRHETITLSWNFLQDYREKFPAYLDGDAFDLKK